MTALKLILAPDPVFRKKAAPVCEITDDIRALVAAMFETLYTHDGLGIGANMVGILKRIVVVDMREGGEKSPIALINPVITTSSDETQAFAEASLSYPGITAEITRPRLITVDYVDTDGAPQTLTAEGWFAQVLQHEIDYLDGRVFLDYLKPVKRSMLLKKMQKQLKQQHAHGAGCSCC